MLPIAIIEDDIEFRDELENHFKQSSSKVACVFAVKSIEAFLKYHSKNQEIQFFLVDINLPGMSGIKGIPKLKKLFPAAEIIMLTTLEDSQSIFQAICAGASGYLIKNLSAFKIENELLKIKQEGGAALSPLVARKLVEHFQINKNAPQKKKASLKEREKQIIRLVVDGKNYEEIAQVLGISSDGVRYHVRNLYKQLQVNSKVGIIRKYLDGFFDWF